MFATSGCPRAARPRRAPLLALALLQLALAAAGAAAQPAAADEVWITIGADAFEVATRALPGGPDGALPRVAEAAGVVLTRVPRASLDRISERLHLELRRCGGFITHDSLAAAQAELARVRDRRPTFVALPFTIDEPWWVGQVAGGVDETQILGTMGSLSTLFLNRYYAHPSGTAAASWIQSQWAALAAGRPEVTVELFPHLGISPQPSVILTIPGWTLPDEIVVLGGHEDSAAWGCSGNPNCIAPGADDNGSGIAVLTDVVRALMAADFRPDRTVQVMAYAAEEIGLDGSGHIAQTYRSQNRNVVAVLQQDMTAWHGSAEDIGLINDYIDFELNGFVQDLLDTYQPDLLWTLTYCGYACSDHASWDGQNYRASFAFESRFDDSNPYIHTEDDTIAHLPEGAAHAAKFARLAAAFLVEASLDGPALPFSDGFETGDTTRWTMAIP